jgi:hypothetical protein
MRKPKIPPFSFLLAKGTVLNKDKQKKRFTFALK